MASLWQCWEFDVSLKEGDVFPTLTSNTTHYLRDGLVLGSLDAVMCTHVEVTHQWLALYKSGGRHVS